MNFSAQTRSYRLLRPMTLGALAVLTAGSLMTSAQAATMAYFTTSGVGGVGNPQALGGVDNTLNSVAYELNFQFTSTVDTETAPIVLWELGATGFGAALILNNDNLHFFVGDGNDDVITGAHGLTAGTGNVQIVSVYEIDGGTGTDDLLSIYVNGTLVASGDVTTADDWAGTDPGGLGIEQGVGGRYDGTALFSDAALISYPTTPITLDLYVLASSGGPVDNTIANIVIPEPSSLAMMGLGLLVLGMRRRR